MGGQPNKVDVTRNDSSISYVADVLGKKVHLKIKLLFLYRTFNLSQYKNNIVRICE